MGKEMIKATGISLSIHDQQILSNISVHIEKGDFLVIIGPNGSGKSSLLRCLSGWYTPQIGHVEIENTSIHRIKPHIRAKHIAWLPQRPVLSEGIPVVEWIASARYRFSESLATRLHTSRQLLKTLNILHLADRSWNTLSGGELQRVALAAMKAQEADLWLLDEPANHLDPAVQKHMYQFLRTEWENGTAMVLVTHNINLILGSIPINQHEKITVTGLKEGKKCFVHQLSDPLLQNALEHVYELPIEKISAFGRPHFIFGEKQ